uniref:Uncharacterized protein n=1 Tax=Anguilla anguilla TaxID=7936 RepID=A0A0E9SVX2_ANGAN
MKDLSADTAQLLNFQQTRERKFHPSYMGYSETTRTTSCLPILSVKILESALGPVALDFQKFFS